MGSSGPRRLPRAGRSAREAWGSSEARSAGNLIGQDARPLTANSLDPQSMALLLTFASERLIELRTISDHVQSLEAAGLSE